MEKTDNIDKQPKTLLASIAEFYGYVLGNIKTRSLKEWIAFGKQNLKEYIEEIRIKAKDLKKTNFELALYHFYKGNLSDARFRFRFVKLFWKDMIECDYFIARTFFLDRAYKKARPYLEMYVNSGDQRYIEEATYCLDVIDAHTDNIATIPLNIIKENYNIYAGFYNQMVEANIQDSPQLKLSQMILKFLNELNRPVVNKVLDLGCGTGLVGKQLKAARNINYMIGVDIAGNMLDEAKILKEETVPVYDETVNLDVDHYFTNALNKEKFDIFIASSLLNYYSDTRGFFENCAKMAVSGALLCITFRTHEQAVLKLFNNSVEEFSYSADLLKKLQSEQGWTVLNEGEIKFLDGSSGIYIISQLK